MRVSARMGVAAAAVLSIWVGAPAQLAAAPSAKETVPSPAKPNIFIKTTGEGVNAISGALHRMDFRVVGKGCAACLLKIQKKLQATPGVIRVAIMLRKPYGATVIYDAKITSQEKILDIAKDQERAARYMDVIDRSIARIPIVLVPIYNDPTKVEQRGDRPDMIDPVNGFQR